MIDFLLGNIAITFLYLVVNGFSSSYRIIAF